MFTLPLLVLGCALSYIYRYYNIANQPNGRLHKFQKRLRVCLGLLITSILMTVAYNLPTEVGQVFRSMQANQMQLAADRQQAREMSEINHARRMIDAFEGVDNYLAYVKSRSAPKN